MAMYFLIEVINWSHNLSF